MTNNGSTPAGPGSLSSARPALPRRGLLGTAVSLALATVGIVGVLGEEAQALYARSVERGQADVERVQAVLRDERLVGVGRKLRALPRASSPGTPTRHTLNGVAPGSPDPDEWRVLLARLNLPTASDVHVLTEQVAELEAQIERLLSARQPGFKP